MRHLAVWWLLLTTVVGCSAQGLVLAYGPRGLERATYRGQVIADVAQWPDDGFHIWHMKAVDRNGQALTAGQYGWGENNTSRVWDLASRSWTYTFTWGTVRATYVQRGNALDIAVTTTNRSDSGIVLDGATVYPLTLHLPGVSAGPRIVDGANSPGVTTLDWKAAEIVAVTPDAAKPVWSGFEPGKNGAIAMMVSGTKPDSAGPGPTHEGRRIKPGESETITLSLRFAASGTPQVPVAADAFRGWLQHWPAHLVWNDRRIIGTAFLASSPPSATPPNFPSNPRRYFNDAGVDVQNPSSLQSFQTRILAQADTIVTNLKRMDAQGAITWDIEGEQFPQNTSYVCAPDQIGQAAPEMESIIAAGTRYAGMKLVDAYFKTIRDAGLRVGVCVRPQRFVLGTDGHAHQQSLPEADIASELIRKMRYAHDRWGATLFYLDSTVREGGATLDAAIIEAAAAAMPDSLLIPEESSFRMYRATAPFMTFLFHGDTGTPADVLAAYPRAFGVNLVNDVDAAKLAAHRTELIESVKHGDILMVHADAWHLNNVTVMSIYRDAHRARAR